MKKINQLLSIIALCSLSLALGACREMPNHQVAGASGGQNVVANEDAQFVKMLGNLQTKNPKQDAQTAMASGERYFLCNAGRSRSVPGLTAEVYSNARERCPTKCLDGVTDALLGENHAKYLEAALQYSAQWNQVMVTACY